MFYGENLVYKALEILLCAILLKLTSFKIDKVLF